MMMMMKARFIPFIVADSGRLGIKAKEYLDNLFQWSRIPRTYDARTSIRKTFISFVGLLTHDDDDDADDNDDYDDDDTSNDAAAAADDDNDNDDIDSICLIDNDNDSKQ